MSRQSSSLKAGSVSKTRKPQKEASPSIEKPSGEDYRPSAINLRRSDWEFLQDVATARVRRTGKGRASVSKLIEEFIDLHRDELARELKG